MTVECLKFIVKGEKVGGGMTGIFSGQLAVRCWF